MPLQHPSPGGNRGKVEGIGELVIEADDYVALSKLVLHLAETRYEQGVMVSRLKRHEN